MDLGLRVLGAKPATCAAGLVVLGELHVVIKDATSILPYLSNKCMQTNSATSPCIKNRQKQNFKCPGEPDQNRFTGQSPMQSARLQKR